MLGSVPGPERCSASPRMTNDGVGRWERGAGVLSGRAPPSRPLGQPSGKAGPQAAKRSDNHINQQAFHPHAGTSLLGASGCSSDHGRNGPEDVQGPWLLLTPVAVGAGLGSNPFPSRLLLAVRWHRRLGGLALGEGYGTAGLLRPHLHSAHHRCHRPPADSSCQGGPPWEELPLPVHSPSLEVRRLGAQVEAKMEVASQLSGCSPHTYTRRDPHPHTRACRYTATHAPAHTSASAHTRRPTPPLYVLTHTSLHTHTPQTHTPSPTHKHGNTGHTRTDLPSSPHAPPPQRTPAGFPGAATELQTIWKHRHRRAVPGWG